mgnify:CR=1 FL=1
MKKETVIKFYLTYRLYLFPVAIAISSLILIFLIIIPQLGKLISNQKAEKALVNNLKFLEVKAQTLDSYDSNDLSNKVSYVLASFPQDKDFGNVIGLIQNLTIQSGFSLTTMTISTATNKTANAQSYSIELEVVGPKNLISILLSNIERSTRLMRVGSIEIRNTISQQTVNISLSLDVLFAPTPASFGSIDSTLPDLSQKDQELLTTLAKNFTPVFTSENVSLPSRGKANPFE